MRLGMVVLGAGALLALCQAGFLLVRAENPELSRQTHWGFERVVQVDVPWGLFAAGRPLEVPLAVWLVIALGGLALLGRPRHEGEMRAWGHAAFWALAGCWMSLTADVRWLGRPISLAPLTVAGWLGTLRKPDRMGVVALLALCALAGLAVAATARRLRTLPGGRPLLAASAAGLLALALARRPTEYPLAPALPSSSAILTLLREGRGAVLELPATWGASHDPSPGHNARAMYRAIFHRRPILNGYHGYWPAGFRERMDLAARLPEAGALARLRQDTGVRSVVVDVDEFGRDERNMCALYERTVGPAARCREDFGAAERRAWSALAARGGDGALELVARDGDQLLFRVANLTP
jgi:hypothetical protein